MHTQHKMRTFTHPDVFDLHTNGRTHRREVKGAGGLDREYVCVRARICVSACVCAKCVRKTDLCETSTQNPSLRLELRFGNGRSC